MPVPKLNILNETIRNLYFHVTMWFSMIVLMFSSMKQSLQFLNGFDKIHDLKAETYASTGIFMGLLGLTTGMIWAQFWRNFLIFWMSFGGFSKSVEEVSLRIRATKGDQ